MTIEHGVKIPDREIQEARANLARDFLFAALIPKMQKSKDFGQSDLEACLSDFKVKAAGPGDDFELGHAWVIALAEITKLNKQNAMEDQLLLKAFQLLTTYKLAS